MAEMAMENTRASRMRYRAQAADGEVARGYTLFDGNGSWLGFVTLEYNDAEHWGRLYSVTGYGNYGYCWDATGRGGFLAFLMSNSDDYLVGKLAQGHDESMTLLTRETRMRARRTFLAEKTGEDSDWLGEALSALDDCRCEADFYDWSITYDFEDVYRTFCWGWGGFLGEYRDRVLPELKRLLWEEANA